MTETVFYRGPSGTTIDMTALRRELDACRAEIRTARNSQMPGVVVDTEESFTAEEWVEGFARLLRRVLPEPAKVISTMSDEQWADFKGTKADA